MNLFFAYMAVAASEEGVKMIAALAMFAVAESGFKEKVSGNPEKFVAYAFA